MKTVKTNLVLFLLLFVFFSTNLFAEDFEGGKKVARGDKLEVSSTNGNIIVTVWDKDEVFIKAKNIDVDDVRDFSFKQNGNVVVFEFKGQDSENFYMEVSIPAYLILDFATGGGNVSIKDKVNGPVEIATGGGNVSLNDVANILSISTGGGNILVGNVSDKVDISTGGGEVKVASALKNLDVSTGGGNISIGSIGGKAEISTGGGNISVGNVSSGIEISTGGGNVKLDGANGSIDVSTGGGNISLKNIKGSVEVSTGSGNIELELDPIAGSFSEISTGNGKITLYLSEKANVVVNTNFLAGKYMKSGSNPQVHLKSDFDGVSYYVNDSKKEMNATLKLNDGGSTIELNVTSGEIFIKKK
ncbi:MAG: DUF4097 domain-containing protein [Ignavibacterium sp.]|jgi:hypothetical protein|nr:DUF4097 domain-containing protein [Ignavibacterium sp.]